MPSIETLVGSALQPLSTLVERVHEKDALLLPDIDCDRDLVDRMKFVAYDLSADPELASDETILTLQVGREHHFLNPWSEKQIYDYLGAKHRWFKDVGLEVRAEELNRRAFQFRGMRLRRMKTYAPINMIRALVSQTYADIPNKEVIDAFAAALPNAHVYSPLCDITDKAMYGHVLHDTSPIGVTREVQMLPGIVVKNSEVRGGALSLTPFLLYVDRGFMRPIVFARHASFRRVHRGQVKDMQTSFETAAREMWEVWGSLTVRMGGLAKRTFATEDDAVNRLEALLVAHRKPKSFIQACSRAYRDAQNTRHTGLTVFQSVLATAKATSLDRMYDDAEVAGFILLALL